MPELTALTATREMGDGLNFAHLPGGRWEMVGVIVRRKAGDRLATLRETGDSAKIGLPPKGRWEIYQNHPISQWEIGRF